MGFLSWSLYLAVFHARGAPPPLGDGRAFLAFYSLALARLASCLKTKSQSLDHVATFGKLDKGDVAI